MTPPTTTVTTMAPSKDFLDEIVSKRAAVNPAFGEIVDAAYRCRRLLREPAARREDLGLSHTEVAGTDDVAHEPASATGLRKVADTGIEPGEPV